MALAVFQRPPDHLFRLYKMPLNIIIVGAGLGGLAAAISVKQEKPDHRVQVIESAPALAEAIQPNRTHEQMLS